jgi:hypothetical protein
MRRPVFRTNRGRCGFPLPEGIIPFFTEKTMRFSMPEPRMIREPPGRCIRKRSSRGDILRSCAGDDLVHAAAGGSPDRLISGFRAAVELSAESAFNPAENPDEERK